LHKIWNQHGIHIEQLSSLAFPETREGHQQMADGMKKIEQEPPASIAGIPVTSIENYLTSIKTDLRTGQQAPLELPKSSVLRLWLEDGSKVMVRPSGTEPKVKFYCGVKLKKFDSIEEGTARMEAHADSLLKSMKDLF